VIGPLGWVNCECGSLGAYTHESIPPHSSGSNSDGRTKKGTGTKGYSKRGGNGLGEEALTHSPLDPKSEIFMDALSGRR
jgi:hypothetical protein